MTELTIKEQRDAKLQTLALAKWMKDSVKEFVTPAESEAKEWLTENLMEPDTKLPATVDGESIATVSRAKVTEKPVVIVEDHEKFGAWLEENGFQPRWERALAPQFTADAFLQMLLDNMEGEIPDGLDLDVKETGGYISVRMTEKQKEVMQAKFEATRSVSGLFETLQIGGSDE